MKIHLSPMDYYFYRRTMYTIQFAFEYLGHLDRQRFTEALNQASLIFPAVRSQITIVSEKEIILETIGSPLIREKFISVEPTEPLRIDDFLDAIENKEGERLFKTLISYTPTRTFIGFSFSHMLGDGTSFFLFLTTLSKLFRRQSHVSGPCDDRTLLRPTYDGPIVDLFTATGYVTPRPPHPKNVAVETLTFASSEIKAQLRSLRTKGISITNNDLIMAELAKRYYASVQPHNDQFILRCPVDYRKIYGLPANYFGNAVRDAIAIFTLQEMENLEIGEIAQRIRQSISAVNRASVQTSLRALDHLRTTEGIGIFENVGCPGLLVTNFSKFPIDQVDFGLGAPIGFHHASLNPRVAIILADADGFKVRLKRPVNEISLNTAAGGR